MRPASRYRHRITVERATTMRDSLNTPVEIWATLCSPKADVRWGSGAERVTAAQEQASQGATFTVRSMTMTKGITVKDRIVFGGRRWDIEAIAQIDNDIALTAVARAD